MTIFAKSLPGLFADIAEGGTVWKDAKDRSLKDRQEQTFGEA